jgi:hypothetical protein
MLRLRVTKAEITTPGAIGDGRTSVFTQNGFLLLDQ